MSQSFGLSPEPERPRRLSSNRLALLGALPAGLAFGAILWLALGGAPKAQDRLDQDRARLQAIKFERPQTSGTASFAAYAYAHPLFALTTGPNAVPDVVVRLDGIARSPGRIAALVSINGAPAQWLEQGKSRSGLTLTSVGDASIAVETPFGQRQVQFAQGPTSPTTAAQGQNPPPGQPATAAPLRPPSPPIGARRP